MQIIDGAEAIGAVQRYREWIKAGDQDLERSGRKFNRIYSEDIKRELRGKDLACWCAPDQACHADVLLEIANR